MNTQTLTINPTENGLFDVVNQTGQIVKQYKCEADAIRFINKANGIVPSAPISSKTQMSSNIPQVNPNNNGLSVTFPNTPKFGINQRFEFLSQLVKMVIADISPSVVITGKGGIGKSYSVMQMMESGNLEKEEDYVVIKGYSTAKGLYRTLHDNNGKIIIFDDCDSVLKDPVSKNILKGALDSYDVREISWNADFALNETLPNSFIFTGKVIFISNLPQESIDQAIISRSLLIDLSMSVEDKLERMETILEDLLPEYNFETKQDAFIFLKEHANKAKDLNMRTLNKVIKIRHTFPNNWKDLALYSIAS